MKKRLAVIGLSLCASLAFGATELPVSKAVAGNAPGDQRGPIAATNGQQTLAIWTDYREGTPQVYGVRLDADGKRIDGSDLRVPIQITPQDGGIAHPAIAYGADRYLVTAVNISSVATDGTIVNTTSLPISTRNARIAFNGGQFLVVGGSEAIFVDRDANPIGESFWPVPRAIDSVQALVFGNNRYLLVYTAGGQLRAAVLGPNGARFQEVILDTANGRLAATAIATPNGFDIAWNIGKELRAARLDPTGGFFTKTQRVYTGEVDLESPSLVAVGEDELLTFSEGRNLLGLSFLVANASEVPRVLFTDTKQNNTHVAVSTGNGATVIVALISGGYEMQIAGNVYDFRVSGASGVPATASTATMLSHAAPAQHAPVLAANPQQLAAAWSEDRGEDTPLYTAVANVFDRDLKPVSENGLTLGTMSNNFERVGLAASDSSFLFVWRQGIGSLSVVGRLFINGQLAEQTIPIAAFSASKPVVASDGHNFFVLIENIDGVFVQRISETGGLLERRFVTRRNGSAADAMGLSCTRSECAVAWIDEKYVDSLFTPRANRAVNAVRFNTSGGLIDITPVDLGQVANSRGAAVRTATLGATGDAKLGEFLQASSDAGGYLIVPESHSIAWDGTDVANAYADANGVTVERRLLTGDVLSAVPIAMAGQRVTNPYVVAFNGSVVVAYERTTRGQVEAGSMRAYVQRLDNAEPISQQSRMRRRTAH